MGLTEAGSSGKYLNIIQGSLRMQTDKENPKAVRRDWETKDGKTGTKYELVYSKIDGYITNIEFRDSDFGEQLSLSISDEGEIYIINMPSDSRYANNFMRRLPGIDLNLEVELLPYDVDDGEKRNVGIKVTQGDTVIRDQYYDPDKKEYVNGMPEMEVENPDKDDWKMFFIKLKKFLKEESLKIIDNHDFVNQVNHSSLIDDDEEKDDLPF